MMLMIRLENTKSFVKFHDLQVEIGEMKRKIHDEVLFAKSPVQMLSFVKTVRSTLFYHRPDYEKLFKLLEDVMKCANYKWSDPYHWEPEKKKNPASQGNKFGLGKKGNTA